MNKSNTNKRTREKIALFRSFFTGLSNVYGTYNPETGRSRQMKEKVTNDTILSHLKGKRPYGVYLLYGDRTRAIAVDFDDLNGIPVIEFINVSKHYGLPAYIETSKSKGFHVWIFFNKKGVKAAKARLVVKNILEEIEHPQTEIFPKQNILDSRASYGNFINAPLFGKLVPSGKSVFIDPYTQKPYPNQWEFLESIERIDEKVLDEIIELNDLSTTRTQSNHLSSCSNNKNQNRFGLLPCARKMLQDGVIRLQRVSCFRLAIHLNRLGLPYDIAVAALKVWAQKNNPVDGKEIIEEKEIKEQTSDAYNKSYRSYGCSSEAVAPFCEPGCPVAQKKSINHHNNPIN